MLMAAHSMDADHCIVPALHSAPLSEVHTYSDHAAATQRVCLGILSRVYRSIAYGRAGEQSGIRVSRAAKRFGGAGAGWCECVCCVRSSCL